MRKWAILLGTAAVAAGVAYQYVRSQPLPGNVFQIPPHFKLQSGETLDESAFIRYHTYGRLNANRSNVILVPACYAQRTDDPDLDSMVRTRFDLSKFFVVIVNLFGNGRSYSPTTPLTGAQYPKSNVKYHDNARAQRMMLQSLGVERIALIYGYSMGGMQALEWAVQFPDSIDRVVAVCASAKTGVANTRFLTSLHDALRSDPHAQLDPSNNRILGFSQKSYDGVLKFGHIFTDWIVGKDFWKLQAYRDFYVFSEAIWRKMFEWMFVYFKWDASEYYSISDTWLHGDVSNNEVFRGDLKAALGSIKAKVYMLPGTTDQYFVAGEIKQQAKLIPGKQLQS